MKTASIRSGFLSAALLCGQASALETPYDGGAQALPLQQSGGTARAMGMGSAAVAVPQESASLLWNPAGLSRMSFTEVGIHHNSGLGGTIQETMIIGSPLGALREEGKGGSMGGIAASFGFVDYGSFQGTDELGQQTGSYTSGDISGSLGWGRELMPGLSGGVVLKSNRSNFAGKSYTAHSADVGFLWNAVRAINLGVGYSNLLFGGGVDGATLASGWRLGAGWTVNKNWLLAAATELQNKKMNRLQFGTEYLIGNVEEKTKVLALRAGYQANYPNPELSGLTGLTFGLGYTITRSIALDYAMLPVGDLGDSHRLSLTFKFNSLGKTKPAAGAAQR